MANSNFRISLPIDSHLGEIVRSFDENLNLILTASPGSGKTTRVPPALVALAAKKRIIILVPKRIAAVSAAARIAEENAWTLGNEVGYQVRFDNRSGPNTKVIFMTEGVFIRKVADDDFWNDIGIIIFDEFHERSSQIDIALGLAVERQIGGQGLKLLVMSATLDATKLQNYLPESSWFKVENKVHPLQIHKSKKSQRLACDQLFFEHLVDAVIEGLRTAKRDTLVFLPGLGEIRFAEQSLRSKLPDMPIQTLHGSLDLSEQREILNYSGPRRIVLATNIAESSITIPGVDLVVDSGLEKKSIREMKIGFRRLEIVRISKFSAEQRAGRAARTSAGHCFQLWHELDERSMPTQIEPEILQSDLLDECLTLAAAGVTDPRHFSWVDEPKASPANALSRLRSWNLLNEKNQLTEKGQMVRSCPLDIERALLFVELSHEGFKSQAARFLAFIETANFEKLQLLPDLERPELTEQGRRIENQLLRLNMSRLQVSTIESDFRRAMIHVYLKNFPNKVAKRKERSQAVSSLGRGIELSPLLTRSESDYLLLFSGRELSSALTFCDFAVGFSQFEFEQISSQEVQTHSEIHFDLEKRRLYRIDRKSVGNFVIKESPKTYVDEKKEPAIFKRFIDDQFSELLAQHEDYQLYLKRANFLKKKCSELGLAPSSFDYLNDFTERVRQALGESVASLGEFFEFRLEDILLFCTPDDAGQLIRQLPNALKLPNGKHIGIDYESEQAPKVSARMQEFFGLKQHPTILSGRLRLTVELLAPNYRPTQTTGQLDNFWKNGYHEIKKELKARYPKHSWPDDPANFVLLPKK